MPINDLYRVVFGQTYQGVIVNNVLYFRGKQAGSTAAHLANDLRLNWQEFIRSVTTSGFAVGLHSVLKVSDLSGEQATSGWTPPLTGLVGGNGSPRILAVVLSLRTPLFGRSRRGRLYIAGFPDSYNTGGNLNSSGISAFTTYFNLFFNRYKVGGTNTFWEFGVYSKKLGGYNLPFSLAGYTGYTYYQITPTFGTERGRKT